MFPLAEAHRADRASRPNNTRHPACSVVRLPWVLEGRGSRSPQGTASVCKLGNATGLSVAVSGLFLVPSDKGAAWKTLLGLLEGQFHMWNREMEKGPLSNCPLSPGALHRYPISRPSAVTDGRWLQARPPGWWSLEGSSLSGAHQSPAWSLQGPRALHLWP